MASLTGASIASSYTSLLKLNGNTDTLVAGNGSNAIQVVDGNGDASPLYLNTDRLGIGGQPTTELHILSSTGDRPVLTIENTNADNSPPSIHLYKNSSGVANNDQMGDISWFANDDGGTKTRSAMIRAIQTDVSASSDDSKLSIYTQKSGTETETMTISSGNVGIGLAPVANRLHIHEADSTQSFAHFTNTTTGTTHNDGLLVGLDASENANIWNRENTSILFATNNAQRMVIDDNSRISLSNNDTSDDNTVFGFGAFNVGSDTGSHRNTAIGDLAMGTGTVASALNNVAIGASALTDLTGGDSNVSIGVSSATNITTGIRNIAIGTESNATATTASDIISIGTSSAFAVLANNTASDGTIAIGTSSLTALTSGAGNVAVGYNTGLYTTTGGSNTYVGYEAGKGVDGTPQTSGNNVAIGQGAGINLQGAATSSTFVGTAAGDVVTTGNNNICIGTLSDPSSATGTNQIVIGTSTTGVADNSVTLGNADVTSVHMSSDSQAYVHAQNVPNHVANTMSSPYYKFDGTGDAISVGDASSTMGKIYSASVFFYIEDDIVADTVGGNGALFTGSGADDDMLWIGSLTGHPINQEIILVGNSSNLTYYQASSLSAGHHHIAISWDGTQYDIYLDGKQLSTTNAGTPALLDSDDLIIGNGDNDSDGYGQFNGQIHSVSFWNKSLTSTEIKQLYSGASVPFKYKSANQTSLVTGSASDFSADDYYAHDTGITVASNVARWSSAGNNTALYKASLLTIGKAYNITFTIVGGTYVTGGVKISIGNTGTTRSSEETFTETVVATSDTFQLMSVGTTTLDIDNLFIRPAGAVAEYDGSSAGSKVWGDKSGNDLHGTVGAGTLDATAPTLENTPYDSGTEYEEGTWTPVLAGASSAGTYTYHTQVGRYTKIGNIVHVVGSLWDIATSSAGSGNMRITGLPYTSENVTLLYSVGTIGMDTVDLTGVSPFVSIYNDVSFLEVKETVDNGADVHTQMNDITSGTSDMYFQISYRCA